jgi:hypothetical protein
MTRPRFAAWAIAAAAVIAASPAHAQAPGAAEDPIAAQRSPAPPDPARFVPGVIAASAGTALGAGTAWGGYDGATRTPLTGAAAEVRLGGRVVLGAGVTYAARDTSEPAALRPSALARVQILDQASHGIDLDLAAAYRQDRFVSEDGLFQATVALGIHSDTGGVLVNLGYGMDGEGDDQLGEARVVAFRRLASTLHVGLDGHVQWLFDSSDPDRDLHSTPSLELTVAPAITYGAGPVTLLVEVGWSGIDRGGFHSGLLALAGAGTAF